MNNLFDMATSQYKLLLFLIVGSFSGVIHSQIKYYRGKELPETFFDVLKAGGAKKEGNSYFPTSFDSDRSLEYILASDAEQIDEINGPAITYGLDRFVNLKTLVTNGYGTINNLPNLEYLEINGSLPLVSFEGMTKLKQLVINGNRARSSFWANPYVFNVYYASALEQITCTDGEEYPLVLSPDQVQKYNNGQLSIIKDDEDELIEATEARYYSNGDFNGFMYRDIENLGIPLFTDTENALEFVHKSDFKNLSGEFTFSVWSSNMHGAHLLNHFDVVQVQPSRFYPGIVDLNMLTSPKKIAVYGGDNSCNAVYSSNCDQVETLIIEGMTGTFEEFDFQGLTSLKEFSFNPQSLIVGFAQNLKYIYNLENIQTLEKLELANTSLTSLEISNQPDLKVLNLGGSWSPIADFQIDMEDLVLSGCPNLDTLICQGSQLSSLDLTNSSKVRYLSVAYSFLLSDVEGLSSSFLGTLVANNTAITDANLSGYSNLEYLDITMTGVTETEFDVTGCTNLNTLRCNQTRIAALDLQGFSNLETLSCGGATGFGLGPITPVKDLIQLNLSGASALKFLTVSYSNITELDVSDSPLLEQLYGTGTDNLNCFIVSEATKDLDNNGGLSLSIDFDDQISTTICADDSWCTVTNTNDDGQGSLRGAIQAANQGFCPIVDGKQLIDFDIQEVPIDDVYTIELETSLPELTGNLVIDAATQNGYDQNAPVIKVTPSTSATTVIGGFILQGANSTVNGFILDGLFYGVFSASTYSDNITISNNFIWNSVRSGIEASPGVSSEDRSGWIIHNNFIGTDPSGADYGNGVDGITLVNNQDFQIRNNVIANNETGGVSIYNSDSRGISIYENQIFNNETAIRIFQNANNAQQPPNITSVVNSVNTVTISGDNVEVGDVIHLYISDASGENAYAFLGEETVTGTTWTKDLSSNLFEEGFVYIVATATDNQGNTSQLSNVKSFYNGLPSCTVISDADSGEGTLREKIDLANLGLCPVIDFDGSIRTIELEILDPQLIITYPGVTVTGLSHPDYTEGNPGVTIKKKEGVTQNISGLRLSADDIVVEGLAFENLRYGVGVSGINSTSGGSVRYNKFKDIEISCVSLTPAIGSQTTTNWIVEHNYFESTFSKTGMVEVVYGEGVKIRNNTFIENTDRQGIGAMLDVFSSNNIEISSNKFSGINPQAIYTNNSEGLQVLDNSMLRVNTGVYIISGSHTISGNKIGFEGLDVSGSVEYGINVVNESSANTIENNEISATFCGIQCAASIGNNVINGNYIGVSKLDQQLTQGTYGVLLVGGGDGNELGTKQLPNVVTNQVEAGVLVNTSLNTIKYNRIYQNSKLGIQLTPNSNGNQQIPTILSSTFTEGNLIIDIGNIDSGDLIQVFVGDAIGESAYEFITETVATGANWSIPIPSEYYTEGDNYYIITSTDNLGNTSQFSVPYFVPGPTSCIVTSTADKGAGSLRDNVLFANIGGCPVIGFDIDETNPVIQLESSLPVQTNEYDILGATQPDGIVTINGDQTSWMISGDLSVTNLKFTNFSRVFESSGNEVNLTVENSQFTDITTTVLDMTQGVESMIVRYCDFGSEMNPIKSIADISTYSTNLRIDLSNIYGDGSEPLIIMSNGSGGSISNNNVQTEGVFVSLVNQRFVGVNYNTVSKAGMLVKTQNSTDFYVRENTINEIVNTAIELDGGSGGFISKNTIQTINDPNGNAISLINGANNDKSVPVMDRYTVYQGNLILTGSSEANDFVEFFLGTAHGQEKPTFLLLDTTDANGDWEISIPITEFDLDGINYIVATARDAARNTSELSAPFAMNLKTCLVTTANDDGDGSLRHALDSANNGLCYLVQFDISPFSLDVDTIKVITPLPNITGSNILIDGSSETGFVEDTMVSVVVAPQTNLNTGLVIENNDNVSLNGLGVFGFTRGLQLSGLNKSQIYQNEFVNNSTGVEIINSMSSSSFHGNRVGLDSVTFDNQIIGYSINSNDFKFEENYAFGINQAAYDINVDDIIIASSFSRYSKIAFDIQNVSDVILSGCFGYISDTSVFINNSTNILVDGVVTGTNSDLSVGLLASNSDQLTIKNSFFLGQDKHGLGVGLQDVTNTVVEDSRISGSSTNVISSNSDVSFTNNDISNSVFGVVLESQNNSFLRNQIHGIDSLGVYASVSAQGNKFISNDFGLKDSVPVQNNGLAIYLVGSDNQFTANRVYNFKQGGIWVEGGVNNLLSENLLVDNNEDFEIEPVKAISLLNNGNNNQQVPVISGYEEVGDDYLVYGTGVSGDTVELFQNNGWYQNAKKYLGKTKVENGEWEVAFEKLELDSGVSNYVVATATEILNTSELSDLFPIGPCYVLTAEDNGDNQWPIMHSVRMAHNCANIQNQKTSVIYAYPEEDTIQLVEKLQPLANVRGIDYIAQLESSKGHILLPENAGFGVGLEFSNDLGQSSLTGLKVSNADTAVLVLNDSSRFSSNLFVDDNFGLYLNSPNKQIIDNNLFEGDSALWFNGDLNSISLIDNDFRDSVTINLANVSHSDISKNRFVASNLSFSGVIDSLKISENIFEYNDRNDLFIGDADSLILEKNEFIYSESPNDYMVEISGTLSAITITENEFGKISFDPVYKNGLRIERTDLTVQDSILILGNVSRTVGHCLELSGKGFDLIENDFVSDFDSTYTAVYLKNVDGAYVYRNNFSFSGAGGVNKENSTNVLLSQNIIVGIKDTLAINLNYGTALQSNEGKAKPEILYAEFEQANCETNLVISGKSAPHDKIEFFESSELKRDLKRFISDTVANSSGDWKIIVPKEEFKLPEEGDYYFTMVALDTINNRSSEVSDYVLILNESRKIIVKNTLDAGAFTLREAVDKLVCTDIYAEVIFNIETDGPHVITLDSLLPELENPLGFSIDGSTQYDFEFKSGDSDEITVVANANYSDFAFRILEESASGFVNNLSFSGFDTTLHVLNDENELDSIDIVGSNNSNTYGVLLDNSPSKDKLSNFNISSVNVGLELSEDFSLIEFTKSSIYDVETGIRLNESQGGVLIDSNSIYAFSVSGIEVLNNLNTDESNVFRNNIIGLDTSFSNTQQSSGVGILIDTSDNQFFEKNLIANIDGDAITIQGNSSNNTISQSLIGLGLDSTVYELTGNAYSVYGSENDLAENNRFISSVVDGVLDTVIVVRYSENDLINSNHIGLINENEEHYNNGPSVYVYNSSDLSISQNYLSGFKNEGVVVESSEEIVLSQNVVFSDESNEEGINIFRGQSGKESNLGLQAPDVNSWSLVDTTIVRVSGTSYWDGADVEVYLRNLDKKQSLKYVDDVLVLKSGSWQLDISSAFFDFADRWDVVAIAIDDNGNTSGFGNGVAVEKLFCEFISQNGDLIPDNTEFCPGSDVEFGTTLARMNYEWSRFEDETYISYEQLITSDIQDRFSLTISDNQECSTTEEIDVEELPQAGSPEFLIPSHVYSGDTVAIVRIGDEESSVDSISWEIPDALVWESGIDDQILYALFPSTDTLDVVVSTIFGSCASRLSKEVYVLNEGDTLPDPINFQQYEQLSILDFQVLPTAVEFGEPFDILVTQNYQTALLLGIFDLEGRPFYQKYFSDTDGVQQGGINAFDYRVEITNSLPKGVYVVQVVNQKEEQSIKFIVE